MTPSDPRRAAEAALWDALEDRREAIRAAGVPFSERQHHQFRKAFQAGKLLDALCGAMERYESPGDPHFKRPMAMAMKHGLQTWEHVFLEPTAVWSDYVTATARRGAKRCIADAREYVPYV